MDQYEFAAPVHALPGMFADRLDPRDLADVRECAEAGEWGEEVDLLIACLRETRRPVSAEERQELVALLQAMGLPVEPAQELPATAPETHCLVDRNAGQDRLQDGWPGSLDARFLGLLALVRNGMGRRDARQLDLLISTRLKPRGGWTVLDELIELEHRGLVRRGPGGTGNRWAITDAGSEALTARASSRPPVRDKDRAARRQRQ